MAMQMSAQAAIALVLFAIVSVLVGSTLSGAAGWRALARRYPGPGDTSPDPVRFRFASMRTSGAHLTEPHPHRHRRSHEQHPDHHRPDDVGPRP